VDTDDSAAVPTEENKEVLRGYNWKIIAYILALNQDVKGCLTLVFFMFIRFC